ncbi:MAG: putative ABC transport system permease protein [Saprospiraceae bacterium]|jgi:putative ABC transport system permease protein
MSSIVLGIAALVAINSFSENLLRDIGKEAKSLLGADFTMESNQPIDTIIAPVFDTIAEDQSRSVDFISMVLFPKNGGTRLAFIKAYEGNFPYYGKFNTSPEQAYQTFKTGRKALVDKTLMIQFNLSPGDSIKVGEVTFLIEGKLISVPGQAGISSSIAPSVYIPMQYLEATKLVQPGSRVDYQYQFKIPDSVNVDSLAKDFRKSHEELSYRDNSVAERQENIGESLGNMNTFLNLIGFIALLLGCIGVASAVHIYVKDKLPTVAILRTIGTSGRQAFWIYLIQIIAMGLLGSIIGAVLGSTLQIILPSVFGEFLPVQNVSTEISWSAISQGILIGLGISLLFALLPLLSIRRISPLRTLRASYEEDTNSRDPLRWLVYFLISAFIAGFTFWQTGDMPTSAFFTLGVGLSFLLLAGVAKFLMWAVRKFFPVKWNYVWRQSIANLYRPNNQTLILMVSIGLGTALISLLFFTQEMLLSQVAMSGSGDQPNMILFDIQPEQKDDVIKVAESFDMPIIQQVPIVTMKLNAIDGIDKAGRMQDTTLTTRRWVYNREYRTTYRDTLIDTEEVIDGTWHNKGVVGDETIYVSIAESIAEDMQAKVGTKLVFDVQGVPIETTVGSIRKINWNKVQTNFFVVFPTGVLEQAPQFNVLVTRVSSPEQSAGFQQKVVEGFSNVSIIDLTQILKSVDAVLSKVSFVIRFMALFSILTGLLVLISSVVISKYQRIKESVLLRTIGASRRQIFSINAFEYFMIGTLATFTGIILSAVGTWLLARFSFGIAFAPSILPPFLLFFSITSLTVLIGLFNSRDVLNRPPLEVLRTEVQ